VFLSDRYGSSPGARQQPVESDLPISAENAALVLVPLLVLAVLWTVVRHWILPFVLGFALAVALGPSARPLMANVWATVADVGGVVFGEFRHMADPRP
jgi:hypothetical protein